MSEASKTHPMICATISTLQMLFEQGEDTVFYLLTDHAIISGIISDKLSRFLLALDVSHRGTVSVLLNPMLT